jgi:diketogulonate reductase-like aldo/keto reductase
MPADAGTLDACRRSLERLGTDYLDLYLLHWQGRHPIAETVAAFEELKREGTIRDWGVSNFDVADVEEVVAVPGGESCVANQVLYNLMARGIEVDLTGWCASRVIPIMAYTPLGHDSRMLGHPEIRRIAKAHGATTGQIALAFVLSHPGVVTIPKASRREHVVENAGALDIKLTESDLAALDKAFPAPRRKAPLEMI